MNIKIKNRFNGNIIVCGEYESIRDCLQKNRGADLHGADLHSTDLQGANLHGTYLRGADLRDADLHGTDLQGADLDIKQMLTNNSVQTILTIINWGKLSDELTLEMMRHDAESCGIEAMTNWTKTRVCPFQNSRRDYLFQEKKELWIEGTPQIRGMELLKALCKEKNYKFEDK